MCWHEAVQLLLSEVYDNRCVGMNAVQLLSVVYDSRYAGVKAVQILLLMYGNNHTALLLNKTEILVSVANLVIRSQLISYTLYMQTPVVSGWEELNHCVLLYVGD